MNLSLNQTKKLPTYFLSTLLMGSVHPVSYDSGTLWFPNLTLPDESLILPLLVGSTFAFNIFISSSRLKPDQAQVKMAQYSRKINIFLYTISGLMVPLAAVQPSALALYWVTSGMAGIVINLVLLSPTFRAFVKIPKTPKDSEHPYLDIRKSFSSTFTKFKR